MHIKTSCLLVAALLQAAAGSAQAESNASASAYAKVSNFRVVLTDVDLTDGITPSLTFVPGNGQTSAYIHSTLGNKEQYLGDTQYKPWVPMVTSLNLSAPEQLSTGQVSFFASVTGSSLETLNVEARNLFDGSSGENGVYVDAIHDSYGFRLSPNTAMSISFDIAVGSSLDGIGEYDHATSLAKVRIAYDRYELKHAWAADGSSQGKETTRTFQSHHTSGADGAVFGLGVETYAWAGVTSPVPEPATYGMLAAGLGVLGAAARRRRR